MTNTFTSLSIELTLSKPGCWFGGSNGNGGDDMCVCMYGEGFK